MSPVLLVNAFDAYAGSQRMAANVVVVLRAAGCPVHVALGFGRRGLLSALDGVRGTVPVERSTGRKLLYPLWLPPMNLSALAAVLRGRLLWANTAYAVPAVLLALAVRPRSVVVHCHELEMPRLLRALLCWASRRGATLLAVSEYQRAHMPEMTAVLPNGFGDGCPPDPPANPTRVVFIGNTKPIKGFGLFIALAQTMRSHENREHHAFLAGAPLATDAPLIEAAEAAGIVLHWGVTEPDRMFAGALLTMVLTDPAIANETFSLVAAESVWHGVPVAGAGVAVLAETCGAALVIDEPSRDAAALAVRVRSFTADPARRAAATAACVARRPAFGLDVFGARVLAVLGQMEARL